MTHMCTLALRQPLNLSTRLLVCGATLMESLPTDRCSCLSLRLCRYRDTIPRERRAVCDDSVSASLLLPPLRISACSVWCVITVSSRSKRRRLSKPQAQQGDCLMSRMLAARPQQPRTAKLKAPRWALCCRFNSFVLTLSRMAGCELGATVWDGEQIVLTLTLSLQMLVSQSACLLRYPLPPIPTPYPLPPKP